MSDFEIPPLRKPLTTPFVLECGQEAITTNKGVVCAAMGQATMLWSQVQNGFTICKTVYSCLRVQV